MVLPQVITVQLCRIVRGRDLLGFWLLHAVGRGIAANGVVGRGALGWPALGARTFTAVFLGQLCLHSISEGVNPEPERGQI